MFIGQAPGQDEDEENKCFVGPSGQLLTDLIKEYGLNKVPYRYEYVCRCAPPNDKKPSVKQIKECLPYLLRSIIQHDPEYIVLLGGIALYALTGHKKISDYSGTMFEISNSHLASKKKTWKVFCTIHPSSALHEPRSLSEIESQFKVLAREVKGEFSNKRTSYYFFDHPFLAEVDTDPLNLKRGRTPIAIDYETMGGFDPRVSGTAIRLVGMSDKEFTGKTFPVDDQKMMNYVKNFLSKKYNFIAHNAKYEMKWSIEKMGIEPTITDDTEILAHLYDENTKVALDVVGPLYTDIHNHKGPFQYYMNNNNYSWDNVPVDRLAQYNCADCDMTLRLYNFLRPKISEQGMDRLYEEIEIPVMKTLARVELRGMKIDTVAANKIMAANKISLTHIKKQIMSMPEVQAGMKRKKLEDLNLNSSVQVKALFYDWWRLNTTKTGVRNRGESYSTDKHAIERLAEHYPNVNLVKKYRGISHGISDIEEMINKSFNGFVSSEFNQTYVVTGRFASRNPNLQNLPNPKQDEGGERYGDAVKKVMISRFGDDGEVMNVDYSQLELRLCANVTRDKTYIEALNKGFDLHSITAAAMFGGRVDEISKEKRNMGKRVNFAVQYGIGANELSRQFKKNKSECQYYLDAYWRRYPGVCNYMDGLHEFARKNEYVVSPFGRRRRLPDINSDDYFSMKRAMNQAGNFPIANMGAELTKWAMARIDQALIDNGFQSMVVLQVHDSVVIDLYYRERRAICKLVESIMVEEAMKIWPFFDSVPLKIDISTGPNLLDQEDI